MPVLHLTDNDFKSQVIEAKEPVLVDFWAEWCGPCKRIAPIIDEIAKEYEGRVKIGKVDVDQARNTAGNYGIMSIPTLMLFKQGQILKQIVGVVAKSEITSLLDSAL